MIILKKLYHRKNHIIGLFFSYNIEWIATAKKIPGIKWSKTNSCWYVPNKPESLKNIFAAFKNIARVDSSAVFTPASEEVKKEKKQEKKPKELSHKKPIPSLYSETLKRLRYSENTITAYQHYFSDFINHFEEGLEHLTEEHIRRYQNYLVNQKRVSGSTQNQAINAIKFYYEKVLHQERKVYYLERPRKEKKLPEVLSKEEVGLIIKNTNNLKHKCAMVIIYSCGLRRREAIRIKTEHVDFSRKMLKIEAGKGNKDRYLQLSEPVLALLQEYIDTYKPPEWLFEGQTKGQYSAESIVNIIKKAAIKAGIKKRVYPHILRHSYATHNLEQGVDIRYIQHWLGHDSIRTTERYTHVAGRKHNFKNPIDDIL